MNPLEWSEWAERLCRDPRGGVQKFGVQLKRKAEKWQADRLRLEAMVEYERSLTAPGNVLCGIDEAGRGPLAGPVVAGAVILPEGWLPEGLNDSKKLSEKQREALYEQIVQRAIAWGVGIVEAERIDEINILEATREAMGLAVESLSVRPDCLVIDAVQLKNTELEQHGIIKGDSRCLSIAAASIIAKVTRDRLMCAYAVKDPRFGYEVHKGYGTAQHYAALNRYGLSKLHRRTFLKEFR